jgi:hypothetical protein
VAEVGTAVSAADFRTEHTVAGIHYFFDFLPVQGLVEAGPAGAGVKFGAGIKQGFSAADATVDTGRFAIPVLAGEWGFGASLAGDIVLLRSEALFPFPFILLDSVAHGMARLDTIAARFLA